MCETLIALKEQLTDIENEEQNKSPINEDCLINLLDMPVEVIFKEYQIFYFL